MSIALRNRLARLEALRGNSKDGFEGAYAQTCFAADIVRKKLGLPAPTREECEADRAEAFARHPDRRTHTELAEEVRRKLALPPGD